MSQENKIYINPTTIYSILGSLVIHLFLWNNPELLDTDTYSLILRGTSLGIFIRLVYPVLINFNPNYLMSRFGWINLIPIMIGSLSLDQGFPTIKYTNGQYLNIYDYSIPYKSIMLVLISIIYVVLYKRKNNEK